MDKDTMCCPWYERERQTELASVVTVVAVDFFLNNTIVEKKANS